MKQRKKVKNPSMLASIRKHVIREQMPQTHPEIMNNNNKIVIRKAKRTKRNKTARMFMNTLYEQTLQKSLLEKLLN